MRENPPPVRGPSVWGEPWQPLENPGELPGDGPLHSELALWMYIAKGLGLLFLGALLLINATYGFWELLSLLE